MNDRIQEINIQEIKLRLEETKGLLKGNDLPMTSAVLDREYLLSEVERLQEENKDLLETAHKFTEFMTQYVEFERMKEALEWYADEEKYSDGFAVGVSEAAVLYSSVQEDRGTRAKDTLSHLKG